ncbi:MAG: dihydroneopterin aldolase [Granulosicoccus sp.]
MDLIFINNLTVETIIGIYDFERTNRQKIVIDLELSADIAKAAATEDINSALNYKILADTLTDYIADSQFQLIETLAERVTEIVLRDFSVDWVRLTLHKPDALSGETNVGVIIERGTRPDH